MWKTGKISEAVLDRSVLRPLSAAGVLSDTGGAFGEDCAISKWQGAPGSLVSATVCAAVGGRLDRTPEMLILSVSNNLAAAGAEPEQILLDILFPETWEEQTLKALMQEIAKVCSSRSLLVGGGHTEISDVLRRPVVTVTAFGLLREGNGLRTRNLKPDQELVMSGWVGLAGTAILARNMEEELAKRYPGVFLDAAKALGTVLSVRDAAEAGRRFGVLAMHDVSQGGVFGALWEMAERAGVGLEVELKKLPVRQETIEICDYFDVNPYQMYGQGALLLGTDRGEALVSELHARGIPAAVIGHTTEGKDRVIRNGSELRYLDRPVQDTLWMLQQK